MRIYSISPMSFTSSTPKTKAKEESKFTKKSFYTQIDGLMNKMYDKKTYLKMFSEGVEKIVEQNDMPKYTQQEREYINNLVSMIDMSEDLGKIPEDYLKKNMTELLKHRK